MTLFLKRVVSGLAFLIGAFAFIATMALFKSFGQVVVVVLVIALMIGLAHAIGTTFFPNPDEDDNHGV